MDFDTVLQKNSNRKTLLFDMWGVLYDGSRIKPQILQKLEQIKQNGYKICIVSNSTLQSAKNIINFETKHNLKQGVHYDHFVTSGDVAIHDIKLNKEAYEPIFNVFENSFSPIEDCNIAVTEDINLAKSILIGNPVTSNGDVIELNNISSALSLDMYDRISSENKECGALLEYANDIPKNLPILCANADIVANADTNKVIVRQGFIAYYLKLLGYNVKIFGKPSLEIINYALQITNSKGSDCIFFDDIENNVVSAEELDIMSCLVESDVGNMYPIKPNKKSEFVINCIA